MSKSILSFFKGSNQFSSSSSSASIVNNVNYVEKDVNKIQNSTKAVKEASTNLEQYHPSARFYFPKTLIGNRERHCQHQWFYNFNWLHYDVKKRRTLLLYDSQRQTHCRTQQRTTTTNNQNVIRQHSHIK